MCVLQANHFLGDGYDTAYRHFRRDHSEPTNLLLHLICLVFQLLGNFLLLLFVDQQLAPLANMNAKWDAALALLPAALAPLAAAAQGRLLSSVTAAAWSQYLVLEAGAPALPRLLASASVLAAFYFAPLLSYAAQGVEKGATVAFAVTLLVGQLLSRPKSLPKGAALAALWGCWSFLWSNLEESWLQGRWAAHALPTALALCGCMLLLSALPGTVPKALVLFSTPVLRLAAIALQLPGLALWGFAFTAMLMQG